MAQVSRKFLERFLAYFTQKEPVHLRLFARLIPTSVIANEVREIDQLAPLVKKLQNREDIANEAIMLLLQSIHTLQIERDPLWSNFFDESFDTLASRLCFGFGDPLPPRFLKRATKTDTTIIKACGGVGRRLLEWIWKEKEKSENVLV